MSKQALKSIHKLISMAVQEAPVEQQFLRDLKASIEMVDAKISRKPSQCYKPSSLKCIRNMYFQVAGVDEDPERGNSCLIGICESGTDRHERIQSAISNMKEAGMDCEYINVADYIKENGLDHLKIKGQTNFETKLYYPALNLSFLCDGIIKYQGKYYILEIKTETIYKWQTREGVADEHLEQACAYSVSLGLRDVMFLYENRDNCDKKAFLLHVTEEMKNALVAKIEECDGYVTNLIPPPKPEVSKKTCSYCKYKQACKKAGA